MSYFHRVEGDLHGNVLTALSRDGYPIAHRMFEAACVGSGGSVCDEAIRYIRKFTLAAGESDILTFVSAGAYFQMLPGFLDLQFAIPLSEHGSLLRKFAGE
eukprot:15471857-Alexandrium_andersonii.AAC.1